MGSHKLWSSDHGVGQYALEGRGAGVGNKRVSSKVMCLGIAGFLLHRIAQVNVGDFTGKKKRASA